MPSIVTEKREQRHVLALKKVCGTFGTAMLVDLEVVCLLRIHNIACRFASDPAVDTITPIQVRGAGLGNNRLSFLDVLKVLLGQ